MNFVKFLAVLFTVGFATAQNGEFHVYGNGLVYSEPAVASLKKIVDSLNVKFSTCPVPEYRSEKYARGHYISATNADALRNDIDNGISFTQFCEKYPGARIDKELIIVNQTHYYHGKKMVYLSSLGFGEDDYKSIYFKDSIVENRFNENLKAKWIYDYHPAQKNYPSSIQAFYFVESFETRSIPQAYARQIAYAECLVNPDVQIFTGNYANRFRRSTNPNMRVYDFLNYVETATRKPRYPSATTDFSKTSEKNRAEHGTKRASYSEEIKLWEIFRWHRTDSLRKNDPTFMKLLNESLEGINPFEIDANYEEYVARYISKAKALELKRGRLVQGQCSMDSRPRQHAVAIAQLSAESVNWDVFLRAHLDIINDRFDRVADSNYGQATRGTYIKELEVLDINLLDLIMGILFRINGAPKNHYYGNASWLGKTLASSQFKPEAEAAMAQLISDKTLDDYNRIMAFYMFRSYCSWLADESARGAATAKFEIAVTTLPQYVVSQINKHR